MKNGIPFLWIISAVALWSCSSSVRHAPQDLSAPSDIASAADDSDLPPADSSPGDGNARDLTVDPVEALDTLDGLDGLSSDQPADVLDAVCDPDSVDLLCCCGPGASIPPHCQAGNWVCDQPQRRLLQTQCGAACGGPYSDPCPACSMLAVNEAAAPSCDDCGGSDWCAVLDDGYQRWAFCYTSPLESLMGAFVTTDDGTCWKRSTQPTSVIKGSPFNPELAASISVPEAALLYVADDQMLRRSIDGGASFTQPEFARDRRLSALTANPATGRVYALDSDGNKLLRSDDGGATYASTGGSLFIEQLLSPSPRAVAVSPANPDLVLVGGEWSLEGPRLSPERVLARSEDGGATYKFVVVSPADLALVVTNVKFAPSNPLRAYAATSGDGVYRSDDAGLTWSHVSDIRVGSLSVHPRDANVVWTARGERMSADGGVTWTEWDLGQPNLRLLGVVCPTNPEEACRQWGLQLSDTGSMGYYRVLTRLESGSWTEVMSGLPAVSSQIVRFDPSLVIQSPEAMDSAVVVYSGWLTMVF